MHFALDYASVQPLTCLLYQIKYKCNGMINNPQCFFNVLVHVTGQNMVCAEICSCVYKIKRGFVFVN